CIYFNVLPVWVDVVLTHIKKMSKSCHILQMPDSITNMKSDIKLNELWLKISGFKYNLILSHLLQVKSEV
ncbi:hypothetical protein DD592_27440, partial [Enterobacter cloacae complex sp. 2DZ2F20B]